MNDTAEVHGLDVDTLAARVTACPSVADLASGAVDTVATYLPGRRVAGVRVADDVVEIHVVAAAHVPVPVLDGEVRAALAPLLAGRRLDIYVDDIAEGPAPDIDLRLAP